MYQYFLLHFVLFISYCVTAVYLLYFWFIIAQQSHLLIPNLESCRDLVKVLVFEWILLYRVACVT